MKVQANVDLHGGGVFLALASYFLVQGIRCAAAVRESKARRAAYNARTAALSYGDMVYVDSGEGEVIVSVHGIFGGYDQSYDTCKDFCSDYRIIAPSRFGYLGSDISGDGTPAEQAAAYVELLNKLGIDKAYLLATSAGGSVAIRFALRLLVKRLGEDDGLGGVVEGVVLSHSGVLPFFSCLFCFCVSGVPFLTL